MRFLAKRVCQVPVTVCSQSFASRIQRPAEDKNIPVLKRTCLSFGRASAGGSQGPSPALATAYGAPVAPSKQQQAQASAAELQASASSILATNATAGAAAPLKISTSAAAPATVSPPPVIPSHTVQAEAVKAAAEPLAAEKTQLEVLPVLETKAAKEVDRPEPIATPAVIAAVAAVAKVGFHCSPVQHLHCFQTFLPHATTAIT